MYKPSKITRIYLETVWLLTGNVANDNLYYCHWSYIVIETITICIIVVYMGVSNVNFSCKK